MMLKPFRPWGLAWAILLLTGCSSLAERIAEPRTGNGFAVFSVFEKHERITVATMIARGGNRIVYRVLPAADSHMRYTYMRHANRADFDVQLPGTPTPVERKGTVIFLHGWGDDHHTMLPWAISLAKHGYVGILPDLRNHGESDRAPAGYGPREAQDIVDLIQSLRASGELKGPVYLLGESLGADVAIMTAADTSAKVDAVIAMEPFVNAGKGVRAMIHYMGKATAAQAGFFSGLVTRSYDDRAIDTAIGEADRRLGLDLNAVDIGPVLSATPICTLVIQGAHDFIFDSADLRIYADAPQVRYLELPKENHFSLPLRIDWLGDAFAAWLDETPRCRALSLPSDPAETAAIGL